MNTLDVYVGMSEKDAVETIRAKGLPVFVEKRDDEIIGHTCDSLFFRVRLTVERGIVTAVRTG